MRKLAIKTAIAISALAPAVALADKHPTGIFTDPSDIVDTLDRVAGWLFVIFSALAVIFFLYAAFVYLTAGGNEASVTRAKGVLIYAVVAIIVATIAAGIPLVVTNLITP